MSCQTHRGCCGAVEPGVLWGLRGLQAHGFKSCPRSECRLGFLTWGNGFLAALTMPSAEFLLKVDVWQLFMTSPKETNGKCGGGENWGCKSRHYKFWMFTSS
ncbi:hypothetical protein E2C01_015837 [Portunus trituberculatus]|uniref:Uncharacterized protein n=1 Tax=Portunus trituberculatus TaxID=210409 RepID=A0A5B7DMJ6_PORTR|nr:hypothetical protein [Portunus trituberculatus]